MVRTPTLLCGTRMCTPATGSLSRFGRGDTAPFPARYRPLDLNLWPLELGGDWIRCHTPLDELCLPSPPRRPVTSHVEVLPRAASELTIAESITRPCHRSRSALWPRRRRGQHGGGRRRSSCPVRGAMGDCSIPARPAAPKAGATRGLRRRCRLQLRPQILLQRLM